MKKYSGEYGSLLALNLPLRGPLAALFLSYSAALAAKKESELQKSINLKGGKQMKEEVPLRQLVEKSSTASLVALHWLGRLAAKKESDLQKNIV